MQQVLRRLPGGSAGSQRAKPFPHRGTACPEPAALPLVPELEAAGVDQCHVGSTSSTRQHPLVHLAHCCRAQHSTPSPAGCPGTRRTCTEIPRAPGHGNRPRAQDRKSTRLNSSHVAISYAVFCLKKKKKTRYRLCSFKTRRN